jgi:hypothetical protein
MFIAARLRQRSANAGLQRRRAPNQVSAQCWKDAVVSGLDVRAPSTPTEKPSQI